MGAEGSEFESRCPDFFMSTTTAQLPYLTFFHRPCRGYTLGGDGENHTMLSPVFETSVDFSSLIMSVDYPTSSHSWMLTEVQVRQGDTWSPFFKLAFYSPKLNHSFESQKCAAGEVRVDVLHLFKPANAYRFLLTVQGNAEIPGVWVCLTDSAAEGDACSAILPAGKRHIKVPPISQMQLPIAPLERERVCSPTSLCMALNALGVKADPLETAASVYDDRARIYGNWTLNTTYACSCGLEAFVTRIHRLAQLKDYISKDSLLLSSISYKRGQLANAAIAKTDGHLVVVCGWENGKVYVADPAAAQTDQVLRAYDAEEFALAWLFHKRGIAYIVRKK